MVDAVDIKKTLSGLTFLKNRTAEMDENDFDNVFAILAETENGGVFAGSFQGDSAWERHPSGDELVQVIDGAADVTVLTDDGPTVLKMTAGMVTVVPRGAWHKFHAPEGVSVMTMTPGPTEHSTADLPET